MPIMQLRTNDDANNLERLDYGATDTGTTSVAQGFDLWNDRSVHVTGELLGTGDGTKTSFAAAFKPFVNDTNAVVSVKADGATATGYTVDHTNGIISFTSPPASGVVITIDYYYSVGSTDANNVVLTVEQSAGFAGDGSTHKFTLPTRCLTALKLLVAGVESSSYELQDNGDSLYITDAPAVNTAIQFYYIDTVCQNGYYEARSSGILNPLSQSGITDDAESAYYKLGGLLSLTSKLIGTGDGSTLSFATGTPLIKSITKVTVSGVEITDYSVNNVTGVITFGIAPASAAEVRVSYTYERGHKIGAIPQWCGRKCFLRCTLPYDAPNSVLSTRMRVITQ